MNNLTRLFAIIGFASISFIAHAGEITDNYSTGDTLTATTLNNIKSAVNDNDTRVTDNEADISTNASDISTNSSDISTITGDLFTIATDIMELQDAVDSTIADFDSSIEFQIPVLSTTSGNTTVTVWLANESNTTCDVYLASRIDTWQIGANVKTFIIVPCYSALSMPAKVIVLPGPSRTTTIVSRSAMNANVSTSAYVDVTMFRNEVDALDSCDAGDISVRGAIATYPDGLQYFVPVKEMVVQ